MLRPVIAALIRTTADQRSVLECPCGSMVRFCTNAASLLQSLSDLRIIAVVLELSGDSESDFPLILQEVVRRVPTIPLLIRLDLRRDVCRKLLEQDIAAFDVRFSLFGHEPIADSLRELVATVGDRTAHSRIVSRVARHGDTLIAEVLTGAALVGDRRVTVQQLAAACNSSLRRIEEDLAESGALGAKRILMRMLALHTHWRVSHLHWSAKRAARAAGFVTADALSRRITRTIGLTLAEMRETRTFDDELDHLVADLH